MGFLCIEVLVTQYIVLRSTVLWLLLQ